MSDEKSLPKIKNNTESNEPPLEYNPNIPMDTIKFRRRISRLNTSMRQIIKRIESRIPKNIGSIFDGKNVIAIHAESLQNFTLDLSFNGKKVTPNISKLAEEGMYFNNFYFN